MRLAFILFFVTLSAYPQTITPSPVIAFRSKITIGDPDRNWSYLYNYDGNLKLVWTVNGQPYQPWPLPFVDCWYDGNYHGGFTATVPGNVTVNVNETTSCSFTVSNQPIRKVAVLSPTNDVAQRMQQYVINGYNDFMLLPGYYQWDKMVSLAPYTRVTGYGAIIKRSGQNPYSPGHYPCFYINGQDISIYGLTFIYDNTDIVLISQNQPVTSGLVVADCTFKRCGLGFFFVESLIRDCVFEGSGAVIAPGGLFWRCTFKGPSISDPWQGWYGDKSGFHFMIVDTNFEGTQRGPVFNGTINDSLFCGVSCNNINRGNNGNEIFLAEGGKVSRFLALHCRVSNCDSSVFQFDGGADNVYIRDFSMTGGVGVVWGNGMIAPNQITNCTIEDSQFNGCGIYFGSQVFNNNVLNSLFLNFNPTRGNQSFSNGSPILYSRKNVVWAEGPNAQTNILTNSPIINVPNGFTPSVGITIKGN